jgi:hypothetical protein
MNKLLIQYVQLGQNRQVIFSCLQKHLDGAAVACIVQYSICPSRHPAQIYKTLLVYYRVRNLGCTPQHYSPCKHGAHSLIIVYVHPEHLPAILSLAGHEVVVWGIVGGGGSGLEAARAAVIGGVAVGGRAMAAAVAAPRQAVRAR